MSCCSLLLRTPTPGELIQNHLSNLRHSVILHISAVKLTSLFVSCSPGATNVEMGMSWLEGATVEGEMTGGGFSDRVAAVSKGEVLRNQQRQKDRPPDPQYLQTLR